MRTLTLLLVVPLLGACVFDQAGVGLPGPDAAPPPDAAPGPDAAPRPDAAPPPDAAPGPDAAPDAGPCPDSDGDGRCDADDVCPGFDDDLDADGDGIPDGCDLCSRDGPLAPPIPAAPAAEGIVISNVSVDSGGAVAIVEVGAWYSITLDYSIEECGCPGCVDQIEIGYAPGFPAKEDCAYSDNPPTCPATDTGGVTLWLYAPDQEGEYDLRFNKGLDYSCGQTTWAWWDAVPPAGQTFGALCVIPSVD